MSKKMRTGLKKSVSMIVAVTTIVWLSGLAILLTPAITIVADERPSVVVGGVTVYDGDLISSNATNPDGTPTYASLDIYIAKVVSATETYKRLVLNPQVFDSYGHLNWGDVQEVSQTVMDAFSTSCLTREDGDAKVYAMAPDDDTGTKSWVNLTETEFVGATTGTYSANTAGAIYTINSTDAGNYTATGDLTTVSAFETYLGDGTLPASGTVAGELSVSLASDTAASTTIISDAAQEVAGSQALVDVLKVNFVTSSGTTAKVTALSLKKVGISSDSDIDNVYLYDGTTKLAEMTSLSSGVVSFSNAAGLFSVNGNKAIAVKFDLNKDTSSGKTIGFQIVAATDITTDGATISGSFPVSGNTMSTAAVTDFGRLQVVKATNSTAVDPGTEGFEAMKLTLTASNQNVAVYRLKLLMLGSINLDDISNIKLYDGGTEISSVDALASDRTVTFDLSASPLAVTAVKNLSVRINVDGGSTRTIQFSLQNATDIEVMDANYSVYLKADGGTIGSFTVQTSDAATVGSGSIVVTRATDSPSGNVALTATNVMLAKYNLQAIGEGIKVSSIEYGITLAGDPTKIKNVRIYYDGAQVGTTDAIVDHSAQGDPGTTMTVNFTVPVGETKTLEIRADIDEATGSAAVMADADTIHAYLDEVSDNGQRVDSLGTVDVPSSYQAGNLLTVSSAALTGIKNASVGAVTVVEGANNQRIGSFLFTAGASESVDVSSIVFQDGVTNDTADGTRALGVAFNNLKLMSGGVQIAPIKVTSSADAATVQYTFYPSPTLSIPAGTTIQVDMYADVLSNADDAVTGWVDLNGVQLDSATGTGQLTSAASNISSSKLGQTITVETGGTLTVAVDTTTPVPTQVSGGVTDQTIAAFKFSANNVEDQTLTQLAITQNNATTTYAADANIRNIKLFVSGAQVGPTVPALDGSHQAWFRNLSVNIPKSGNTVVTVKADITPYAEGESVGNYVVFKVVTPGAKPTGATADTVITKGATSGAYATPSPLAATTYYGNAIYPYRTTLTADLTTTKAVTGNTRSANDTVAKLALAGTTGADAQFRAALLGSGDNTAADGVEAITDNHTITNSETTVDVDGKSSIWTLTAVDAGDSITFDAGNADILYDDVSDVDNYSRVSFWIRSNRADTPKANFAVSVSTTTGTVGTDVDAIVIPELAGANMTVDTWYFVDMAIPTLEEGSRYIHIETEAVTTLQNGDIIYIDEFRVYNDSMVVDVSGDLAAVATSNATPVYLKISGTTVAVGYFVPTLTTSLIAGSIKFIADSEISVGSAATTYDMITSSTALMADDASGITEGLSLSMDAGSISMSSGTPTVTAGDFNWYDQAVTAITPVTWINPSGTVYSVTMGY